MHGRKKIDRVQTEEELHALSVKTKLYSDLIGSINKFRLSGIFTEESLQLTSKLLKANPDYYTIWNYRRNILISLWANIGLQICQDFPISTEAGLRVRDTELSITSEAIKKNPKSYGAWYHRRWISERFTVDHQAELDLCKSFLSVDQRNFHCWNYRKFLWKRCHGDIHVEIDYTLEKIQENFSNYSAFHHRSVFIKNCTILNPTSVIEGELKLLENAYYTEPDDQSTWWYLQFILKWIEEIAITEDTTRTSWAAHVITNQLESLRALKEIETNCKWAYIAITITIELLIKLSLRCGISLPDSGCDSVASLRVERVHLLRSLKLLDSTHSRRYDYLLSKYGDEITGEESVTQTNVTF